MSVPLWGPWDWGHGAIGRERRAADADEVKVADKVSGIEV